MLKLGAVVILMQQNSNDIINLFPVSVDWEMIKTEKTDVVFSENTINYLNELSKSILKDPKAKLYPDVITFAFFCRRANIERLKGDYSSEDFRIGRGVVFHIAPSNVPINFAFSLVAGLLSGNKNIVKVSYKQFTQVDIVVRHLHLLEEQQIFSDVSKRIAVIRFPRTSNATEFFSSFCDIRVIWGGNDTIEQIRKNAIPSRSFDITFANRYSFAVINAEKLINENNIEAIVHGFYNDTYLFDQNACSAPHLVVWLGNNENVKKAKVLFWEKLGELVDKKYEFQNVMAIDKEVAFYRQAISMSVKKRGLSNNKLYCVEIKALRNDIEEFKCIGGYFTEYTAEKFDEIAPIIKNNYQTMAYYGIDSDNLIEFMSQHKPHGIDRFSKIGLTTQFSLTWDGYNLISSLSRTVQII
jgi:hypothetical protein